MKTLETDFLIVGAGAMGMAFADTLLAETQAATLVIVDRNDQPGGHWTAAYPFVRLHQPSAFYGVNSRSLGSDVIDQTGWNAGLYELASGGEVCAYLDQVMQQQLLPTGRVQYFPMSEYRGDGRVTTLSGDDYQISVRRAVVDATYLGVVVPSMRPPPYPVAAGVDCVAPNELPRRCRDRTGYVVIGAGKTGIDSCLWLLRNGIHPEALTWIMPRDAWLLDRATIQPGALFAPEFKASFAGRLEAISQASSVHDLFDRLEEARNLLRFDPAVRPRMYRCATVSRAELDQLRRITNVVRAGHLQCIEGDRLVLDGAVLRADPTALYIDCTADGLRRRPATPVFDGQRITLQSVRGCQQVFSAAFVAHVEACYGDDATKNDLCTPIPHPESDLDWLRLTMADNRNQMRWLEEPELMHWLQSARLNILRDAFPPLPDKPAVRDRITGILKSALGAANEKLAALLKDPAGPR